MLYLEAESLKDIDSDLKAIQDALEKADIIEDDKQIRFLVKGITTRKTEKRGKDNIKIRLTTLDEKEIKKLLKKSYADFK